MNVFRFLIPAPTSMGIDAPASRLPVAFYMRDLAAAMLIYAEIKFYNYYKNPLMLD